MRDAQPKTIYLKEYSEPDFWIDTTHLEFDLQDRNTRVSSVLSMRRNPNADAEASLVLHGQEIELESISIDGRELNATEYRIDENTLTVFAVPDAFELGCVTLINPVDNTSLEGLYRSRTMYCTQCEAEGFRKITYYLDRPDVMSVFTTRVIADRQTFPVLLSNGNPVGEGQQGDRHWAEWHDPHPKPCYLFALVAGDLVSVDDNYVTSSGRDVKLQIFVEPKDVEKCGHAMASLKNAMRWDEDVYGREYDLDIFMVVAVDDFNMGAMENKGLNIFNTSCVLASPETTTDAGYQRVEGVVAHEYFHNWSGNRVTCRDWFQLSLKEGFTVFRDSEFSADMGSRTVKRVEDVSMLRSMQFAEDAGPMAHPVQPSSYMEISNFYTLTIYEKGAEVVRMIHTLIGPEKFRQGSDLYFARNDGRAVTIEDFVAAMSEVSGRDFSQFMNWYQQAGTPSVKVSADWDEATGRYTLDFSQHCPPTPECDIKKPFVIPVRMGLLGADGPLKLDSPNKNLRYTNDEHTEVVFELSEEKQTLEITGIDEQAVPVLLRGFSAPVKLKFNYSREQLLTIMRLDPDGFCRWDATQQLAVSVIEEVMAALVNEPAPQVDADFIEACRSILTNTELDPAMVALMLTLPSEDYLGEQQRVVEVESIHHARNRVKRKLATALYDELMQTYQRLDTREAYSPDADAVARRSLKNCALAYLVESGREEAVELCRRQFEQADNMTDRSAALMALVHSPKKAAQEHKEICLQQAWELWQDEPLAVNLWFSVQATSPLPDALLRVKELMQHPAYDSRNPNKLRAVLGGFAMRNPINFHDGSGSGYDFLADQVIDLDSRNPQIAARLLTPLTRWKKYDENRQAKMLAALTRIKEKPDLSNDVYEVVEKSLANAV